VLGADGGWQDVVLRHNQVAVLAGYTLGCATVGRVRVCRHRVVGVAVLVRWRLLC
jgi:isopenicillin N synthase-like dioxygenase